MKFLLVLIMLVLIKIFIFPTVYENLDNCIKSMNSPPSYTEIPDKRNSGQIKNYPLDVIVGDLNGTSYLRSPFASDNEILKDECK